MGGWAQSLGIRGQSVRLGSETPLKGRLRLREGRPGTKRVLTCSCPTKKSTEGDPRPRDHQLRLQTTQGRAPGLDQIDRFPLDQRQRVVLFLPLN